MKSCARALGVLLATAILFAFPVLSRAQVQVGLATPNSAVQGTVNLDVVVTGSGFKQGAKAQWLVSGTTNPGGVTVNSTAFNSANQLTANITVAANAVISGFDILVTNTNGRSGKGTELFAVQSSNGSGSPKATCPAPPVLSPPLNVCSTSTAQTSCLDASFGNGGLVETSTNTQDIGHMVRQQTDGKLVVIGQFTDHSGSTTLSGVILERYNSDGSLDTAFASSGVERLYISGTSITQVDDGLIDLAGNILAIGFNGGNTFVARFTPSGSPDTTFGSGGLSPFTGYGAPFGLAIQPDGKIVLSTKSSTKSGTPVGYVLRMNPNGGLDTTFGTKGAAQFSGVFFTDVALQQINAATSILATTSDFSIVRYTPAGALDTSFGTAGVAKNALCGSGGEAWDIAVDPVSGIYVAGYALLQPNGPRKIYLAKYTNSGQLDPTFGDAANYGQGPTGATILDFNGTGSNGNAGLEVTSDSLGNRQILVGVTIPTNAFYLARYKANGALDTNWGGVGAVGTTFNVASGWKAAPSSVAVQGDGRILQVGTDQGPTASPTPINIALARFWQ